MVVVLIALTSAILVPAMLRTSSRIPTDAASKLTTSLEELSERSLFLGQVTALRITDSGYTPLYYDISSGKFVAFKQANLGAVKLPDNLRLDWRADGDSPLAANLSQGIARQHSLDDTATVSDRSTDNADTDADTESAKLPQIFFLPGGQATSGELTLANMDAADAAVHLQLNPLGRVTRLDRDNPEDDDESSAFGADANQPPLLLPKNSSLSQRGGAQ